MRTRASKVTTWRFRVHRRGVDGYTDRDDDRDERTDDGGRDDDDDDEDDEDDDDASSTRGSHSNGLLETRARGDDEDDARRG